jgi:putative ATP-binding cassette transporter
MDSKFITLLRKESGVTGVKVFAIAIVAGLLQGLLMVIINGAAGNLPKGGLNFRYFGMFAACIIGFIWTKRYSLSRNVDKVLEILFDIRIRIADKIRHSGLYQIETVGKSELYTALADNTEIIFSAARQLASASASGVMIIFSFLYIGYLSSEAFVLSAFFIVSGVSVYLLNQQDTNRQLTITVEKQTEFVSYINHLLEGFKEVKINSDKSHDLFHNYLKETSVHARDLKVKIEYRFVDNYILSQSLFYMLMAAAIFLLPQISSVAPGAIVNITAVILFMVGPLGDVVEAIPRVAKADVAVDTIEKLEKFLDEADDSKATLPSGPLLRKKSFEKIHFKNVIFSYGDSQNRYFTVGPIDLSVQRGEILFIVGGNGSGKSTLLKIMTGLYYPQSGEILIDNIPLDMSNYEHYRNLFSVIFTDFHLFDRLYGLKSVDEDMIDDMLAKMELASKTAYSEGRFTNINLSTGQKKRLAMIISYLEDKPIFMFDEVAADQDPVFRKYFYEVFIKNLKAKGKTIIAVSHDDRYFNKADRVLKMEFGKFVSN